MGTTCNDDINVNSNIPYINFQYKDDNGKLNIDKNFILKKNNNFLKIISPQVLYENFGFQCINNIDVDCSWIHKDIEQISFFNSNNELEKIDFSSTQIVDNRSECIGNNVKDVKHKIINIPSNLINYTNLKILNFSDNNLQDTITIDGITKNNLEQINNNNLEEIYLHNTEKYQKLGGNNLTEITDNIFRLSNLSILNISGNNITTLSQNINNLINLKILNLSSNQIKIIPNLSLSNIEQINLSNNEITNFPEFTTPNIKNLYLNNNKIINFTINFKTLLNNINHTSLDINISNNNINESFPGYDINNNFNDDFIQIIIDKCFIFNIKSNFFSGEVSCDLAGQFGYENLTQKNKVQLETNPKTCTISEKLENKLLYRPEINYYNDTNDFNKKFKNLRQDVPLDNIDNSKRVNYLNILHLINLILGIIILILINKID